MERASQSTVLGKRKTRPEQLVLHLTSPSSTSAYQSDSELSAAPQASTSSTKNPILINGNLVANTKKRYFCTYNGCEKGYYKPSRLEEHERSHTGQRPFVCETCGKSYLRETHLNAHTRSHMPNEMRSFACEKVGCDKRFWTSQHLQTHHAWHDGSKQYKCQEIDCEEAFAKHHQLRAHICSAHAPPGTKPYRCDYEGCTKSFDTNQHLRSHQKTHDSKRYTCVHATCLANPGGAPTYFSTWSSLQSHIRKSHPPTCPHAACHGKTFSNTANLRAHLKLHEQKDVESEMMMETDLGGEHDEPHKKRRRGGDQGRDWPCEVEGCDKDFKSRKALQVHTNVTHLGRRDFACHYKDCARSFGYKHLLQRHVAKVHPSGHPGAITSSSSSEEVPSEEEGQEVTKSEDPNDDNEFDIDMITGNAYAEQAEEKVKNSKYLRCPYPELQELLGVIEGELATSLEHPCNYVFSRAYDLRRHLVASHSVEATKEVVDSWVKKQKRN